ncbi:protein POLLEN DEFECTIVE IN GUIDANCE 1-like [Daucus carota subsp. sativus]|uniref:protein POLLEN DEFECTIVE IN GUIDANCE 1-like n=1 Tax=Daucus carota subsp. sativus TaxID=79200 RepID=UPI0007EF39DA|nr:PREDICTED: protein POLLEN DEFECTIVE IN GUIDANCE 1-like [Daucus carota subsp. sativus]
MASRLRRRNLSFELLSTGLDDNDDHIAPENNNFYRSTSDPLQGDDAEVLKSAKRRKKRRNRGGKGKKSLLDCVIAEETVDFGSKSCSSSCVTQTVVFDGVSESNGGDRAGSSEFLGLKSLKGGGLRQRNVNSGDDIANGGELECVSSKDGDLRHRNVSCGGDNVANDGELECVSSKDGELRQRNVNHGGNVVNGGELEHVSLKDGELRQRNVNRDDVVNGGVNSSEYVSLKGGELRQRNVNGGKEEERIVCEDVKGGELRQRGSVNGSDEEKVVVEDVKATERFGDSNVREVNGNVMRKLESETWLDWKKLMAEDPNYNLPLEKSPLKYFIEEMYDGNSLRNTTITANEKDRERVYDTIFRLPWRCELLINVGFFVCLDSFLSLVTIMPTRLLVTTWKHLQARQFRRLSAAELSDFGCFLALVCGVILLQQTDISLIYHMIRGQGTIKLYVVYNVLEIFDKLCQSFGGDVLQTLFNSADGLANCSPESRTYWLWRFISDEALTVTSSIIHSFILLAQAITLSTCIVAHNNALPALLVSNNFAEIKSNVFKRFSKDNVQSMVYYDSVERFHISAFILFILAQNILEAESPWFENFLCNASMVFICEVMIDIIKHSFIAKFNDIKPIVFSEFLEDLCRQRLNLQMENGKRNLTFVPLAPACVVIRVLSPIYAAHLPHSPLLWRLFWICILSAMTFVMLTSLKVMVGMGLQKHATWYVKRCQNRKLHND